MAIAALPELDLATLVASVPIPQVSLRDPYVGFGFARAGEKSANRTGEAWLLALDTQFERRQVPQAQGAFRTSNPYDRMFDTQLGAQAAQIVGNESRTLGQIGTLAAETLAAAMTFAPNGSGAGRVGRHFWAETNTRTLVLSGDPASDIAPTVLLLDPDGPNKPSRITDRIGVMAEPLMAAERLLRAGALDNREMGAVESLIFGNGPDALLTALWIVRPEVIIVRAPRMVPVSCPSPALEIRAGSERSSAGIFCRDAAGTVGFTACFHGTGLAGTAITLGGRPTAITLVNPVQDLVFAPLPAGYVIPNFALGSAGIRRGRAPAQNDPASFDGCTSGSKNTVVTSHDAGLLRTSAALQLKVQTTAALNRGDSGSALIDAQDQVMAFAFQRTAIDEMIQFADWIWAANAFDALGLQPL